MSTKMIAGYHDLTFADRDIGPATTGLLALGITGDEGIRLSLTREFQDISGDALGANTVVDQVYQGGNCFLEFVLQEINDDVVRSFLSQTRASATAANTPFHHEVGLVGHLASSLAGTLVATPRTGTSAALAHGATSKRTFVGMVIGDLTESLDTGQNAIPIRFRCFPFTSGGLTVWWTWA